MIGDFFQKYNNRVRPGLPKYLQLRDIIATAIEDGYWGPGDQMPGEADMARVTSFSLGTVQKALKMLEEEGIIYRKQGHGTFVTRKTFSPQHCRFLIDGAEDFYHIRPVVIARQVVKLQRSWTRHITSGGENLLRIDRVINVEDQFTLYNSFYINKERFPLFGEVTLNRLSGINLKAYLKTNYDILITHTSNYISLVKFPDRVYEALGVDPGCQGVLFEVLGMAGPKNPVYFSEFYIPPSNWKMYISDLNHPPYFWVD